MIVAITKGNFAKGLIDYHEKKIENGRGELILDSTFSRSKGQRIAEFIDLAELNRSVKKDRYTHISVSFSDEDQLDREKQLKIAERYLEGMGYSDAPRLIYEHSDTSHRHFHIVTSTIDLNGKKIDIFRDHFRNQELSRQIEKEFGLKVTEYFRQEQQKLQEINATKYSLLKGIEKISQSPEGSGILEKVVSAEIIRRIVSEKLSNDDIKQILAERVMDGNVFNQLYRILRQSNAEYKTEKEQLRDRLNYIKTLSRSRDEFVQRCEQQGIYVRKISGESGSARFTYGNKEKNFYVVEKDLPAALRHDYLFTGKAIPKSFDESTQRKFIKRIIARCLKQSSSLKDFESHLLKAGVKTEYSTNAGGRYGVAFKSNNIKEALPTKGSEIGLSWNKLKNFDFANTTKDKAVGIPSRRNVNISKSIGNSLDTSQDDEQKGRSKGNHDQSIG
jgi:hypothetical protein